MESVANHCPVHPVSNIYCPSCIVAFKLSAKVPELPAAEEDNPEPKEESKEEHHEN